MWKILIYKGSLTKKQPVFSACLVEVVLVSSKVDDDYETWALWQAPEVLERIQDGHGGGEKNQRCKFEALFWGEGELQAIWIGNLFVFDYPKNHWTLL